MVVIFAIDRDGVDGLSMKRHLDRFREEVKTQALCAAHVEGWPRAQHVKAARVTVTGWNTAKLGEQTLDLIAGELGRWLYAGPAAVAQMDLNVEQLGSGRRIVVTVETLAVDDRDAGSIARDAAYASMPVPEPLRDDMPVMEFASVGTDVAPNIGLRAYDEPPRMDQYGRVIATGFLEVEDEPRVLAIDDPDREITIEQAMMPDYTIAPGGSSSKGRVKKGGRGASIDERNAMTDTRLRD